MKQASREVSDRWARCPTCGWRAIRRGLLGGACVHCGKTARDRALAEQAVVKASAERVFTDFARQVARFWDGIPMPPAEKNDLLERLATRLAADHPDLVDQPREEAE